MPPVAVIEKIRAPAEDVFGFIGHVETHPQIADFSQSVRIISEKKTGVGTRFHQVYTSGAEHISEMMVWEPYKKIVWHNFEGDSKTHVMIISYHFEEEGPYTHVLHTVECDEYENQAKHRDGTLRNIRELANLKRILEGE
ncbi:MAG: hypothetical protein OXG62_04400 [Nitrospinae bacterium]|nr:hypothetical protein [Nitrospinota bacterium]